MSLLTVDNLYKKDKNLNKKDVQEIINWAKSQPKVPEIDEQFTALFLQKYKYDKEVSKKAIEDYFSHKRKFPAMFTKRNPALSPLKLHLDHILFTTLPSTPEGYTPVLLTACETQTYKYDIMELLKAIDMVMMLHLAEEGSSPGYLILCEVKDFKHEFVKQFANPSIAAAFLDYLQRIVPWEFRGLHYFNPSPYMDELLEAAKAAMDPKYADKLHVHDDVEELSKYVPKTVLPNDYGGEAESRSVLHERSNANLLKNDDFFAREDKQLAG